MTLPGALAMASPTPEELPWRANDAKFVVAAENLTSLHFMSGTYDVDGEKTDFSSTQVSFLYGSSLSGEVVSGVNPYSVPFLGFHGVVAHGLTLGGNFGIASIGGETQVPGETVDRSGTVFVIAPRVGWIISTSSVFSIWLRAGITHSSLNVDSESPSVSSDATITLTSVTVDPQLVFTPLQHVGFLLGVALNPSVSGSQEGSVDSGGAFARFDGDLSVLDVGITAGVALLF